MGAYSESGTVRSARRGTGCAFHILCSGYDGHLNPIAFLIQDCFGTMDTHMKFGSDLFRCLKEHGLVVQSIISRYSLFR